MTATSALSTSNANLFIAESAAEVRLPGSDRTYTVRDVLRGMGLRWDPATHAWHGRLIAAQRAFLERQFALPTRAVVPIEAFASASTESQAAPRPPAAPAPSARPRPPAGPRGLTHDYSRTRFESRLLLPGPDEDADEIATSSRTFTLEEITSGLPDDSREADERAEARQLRELRARVKVARALVANTPGLLEILRRNLQTAARFYARCRITESMLRYGIREVEDPETELEKRARIEILETAAAYQ